MAILLCGGITPKWRGGDGGGGGGGGGDSGGWMNPVSKHISSVGFKLHLNMIFNQISTHFLYHGTPISVNRKLVNIIV
jgi:hypothetical protein